MTVDAPSIVLHPRTAPPKPGPTCVDLFSGAGGLAVGFRRAGWSILAANDSDVHAGETFRLNFPETTFFEGPISEVTATAVLAECGLAPGELDCLIGGPPCQSFSHNNHQRSATDARARLFDDYLDLVEGLSPKTLIMENVPGILSIDSGSVICEIKQRLSKLGYDAIYKVISAEEYGTPQVRRRVFIVGSRIAAADDLLPSPTHGSANPFSRNKKVPGDGKKLWVSVEQAIGDLPEIHNGGGSAAMRRPKPSSATEFQIEARKGAPIIYNHECHALSDVNMKRVVEVPEGGNWRDIPRELLPKGMQRARLSDHTKRYGRLARGGLASTILTKCDPHWGAYIHPTQDRTISVREAARLQGFPDTFQFAGCMISKHYEQVGNAVPVPVAVALGRATQVHLVRHCGSTEAEIAQASTHAKQAA